MLPARLLPYAACVLAGCLYAAPMPERAERNYAPVVREVTPDPDLEEHLVVAPNEPLTFRVVSIEDPNVGDRLDARWFVDAAQSPQPKSQQRQPPTGAVERVPNWEYTINTPCSITKASDRSFYTEVVISDREFEAAEDLFRVVPEDAHTVHLGWRVRIDDAAAGECPRPEDEP